jgi:hypothetical protein
VTQDHVFSQADRKVHYRPQVLSRQQHCPDAYVSHRAGQKQNANHPLNYESSTKWSQQFQPFQIVPSSQQGQKESNYSNGGFTQRVSSAAARQPQYSDTPQFANAYHDSHPAHNGFEHYWPHSDQYHNLATRNKNGIHELTHQSKVVQKNHV